MSEEKKKNPLRRFFRPSLNIRVTLLIMAFLLGYNAVSAMVQPGDSAIAVVVKTTPIYNSYGYACVAPCDPGAVLAPLIAASIITFRGAVSAAALVLEEATILALTYGVVGFVKALDSVEAAIVKFWWTNWFYNIYPAMRAMTNQNVYAMVTQSKDAQKRAEAENLIKGLGVRKENDIQAHRMARPSENAETVGTVTGGQSSASSFSRAMRSAWSGRGIADMSNGMGSPAAAGAAAYNGQRYQTYRTLFCNPDAAGGKGACEANDPKFYDADTQPTQYIYNKLTVPIDPQSDPEGKMAKAVEAIIDNMVGVPVADPLSREVLQTQEGREIFLERRSYLARYSAARSIPEMVAGWRVPGSMMGDKTKALRSASGMKQQQLSLNPSYKEIMHAMTVDRFNSGQYAFGLITDQTEIEMEKLTLSALYLMQLRDYYELLERTALTLSIQVSMMADQVPMPDVASATPAR